MTPDLTVDEARLRRFARLVSGQLRGAALQGSGLRAATNRGGRGLEYLDTREYAQGDDVRHVDWRQTMRRGRPMLRRYRDESASEWLLCIDGSASMAAAGKWRFACELAIALTFALLYGGHRVSIAIFAERIRDYCRPGRGARHFAAVLRSLASYEPASRGGDSLPGACVDVVARSGNLFVISDFLREDRMADDLRQLRAAVAAAASLQIRTSADVEVRGEGVARLVDVETAEERRAPLSAETRAAAAAAQERHSIGLRNFAASINMPFSTCSVGDDWERALLAHFGV